MANEAEDTRDLDLAPDEDAVAAPADDAEAEAGPEHRQFVLRRDLHKRIDVYLHGRLKGISRSKVQQLIELGGVTVNGRVPKPSTTVRLGDRIDVILPPPAIRKIVPEPIPLHVLYEDAAFIVINKQADLIVHPARSHLTGTLVNALAHHFQQQAERAGGQWGEWKTTGFRKPDDDKGPPSGKSEIRNQKSETPNSKPETRNSKLALSPGAEPVLDVDDFAVPGLSRVGAEACRPGIVHRLDKNTTGVIVVAKTDEAHWKIARQFENRSTIKAYLAVVHGSLDGPGGVLEYPIGKHPTIREAYAVRHDSQARPAVTLYRVRERYAGYTLVELELKTGRTHQIRVHLSYLGHPIVGDLLYGGEAIGVPELDHPPTPAGARRLLTFAREKDDGLRLEAAAKARGSALDGTGDLILACPALHAAFLRFLHPLTGQPMIFTAPVHEPMATLIRELRKRRVEGPVATEGTWVDLRKLVAE